MCDYRFDERLTLIASAVSRMAFQKYSKLLPFRTRPYQVFIVRPGLAEIGQDGVQNTVSIFWLTRLAEERRSNISLTSDSRANTDTNPAKESSIEEQKNS